MNVQLKAFLIFLAAFLVYDAFVWEGRYRIKAVNKASWTIDWVMTRDW